VKIGALEKGALSHVDVLLHGCASFIIFRYIMEIRLNNHKSLCKISMGMHTTELDTG
jgi:hypothetical protein